MNRTRSSKITLLIAWIVVLLTSTLPQVILQEIFGQSLSPDMQAVITLGVIFAALLATLIWQPLRGLRPLLALFTVLVISQWLVFNRIDQLPFNSTRLRSSSFNVYMLAEQSLNLIVTLVMIASLSLMRKKRRDFYLALGDVDARVGSIPWLGVRQGERWNKFGALLAFFLSLGTLTFLVIAGRPSLGIFTRVLPFLPAILLAAALNAFNEELTYKASFLSVLEGPVGSQQALLMIAAYFGILHFLECLMVSSACFWQVSWAGYWENRCWRRAACFGRGSYTFGRMYGSSPLWRSVRSYLVVVKG